MLKKLLVSIIVGFSCLFLSIGYFQADEIKNWEVKSDDIREADISVTLSPIINSAYCYTFHTNSKSQIEYISHFLNVMEFIDDGK